MCRDVNSKKNLFVFLKHRCFSKTFIKQTCILNMTNFFFFCKENLVKKLFFVVENAKQKLCSKIVYVVKEKDNWNKRNFA